MPFSSQVLSRVSSRVSSQVAPWLMRAGASIVAAIVLNLTIACGGPVTVTFEVPVEDTVEVDGAPLGGLLNVLPAFTGLSSIDLSASQEFENNNVAKENVEEVLLTTAKLTVIDPSDGDLDFINDMSFFIKSPAEARQRVASKNVPNGVQTIDLEIDDANLAPYVRDESMTIDSEVSGQQPNEDTTLRVNLVFFVTAVVNENLLNAL